MSKRSKEAAKMDVARAPEPPLRLLMALPSAGSSNSGAAPNLNNEHETSDLGNGDSCFDEGDNYNDHGEHPYETETRLNQEEREKRSILGTNGRKYGEIEFSMEVVGRQGDHYGSEKFCESQGAIGAITLANESAEYRLTIGTCGDFAPSWVKKSHHDRPMWILHCPDLSIEHIEGCCFFEGLANNTIGVRNYSREGGTVGISYLTWQLGKFDEIVVQVDVQLLESMRNADKGESSILIAFVGQESCTLASSWIAAGMLDWLNDYERSFADAREAVNDSAILRRRQAENSIREELMSGFRPPKLGRVVKWSADSCDSAE
jgi:hypothetical protein